MIKEQLVDYITLHKLIDTRLKPYVKQIDEEAFYAKEYLTSLGEHGFYLLEKSEQNTLLKRFALIEETAKVCMTTAFCLWCHLAATTYITHTPNRTLRNTLLPKLTSGTLLAGTGLSNPLKSFAKLEPLHLKAERIKGGFIVNGSLPAISNIGPEQAFAFIAEEKEESKVMGLTFCNAKGLKLRQRTGFIGVNGSATYSCTFKNVFIPETQIITEAVDSFIEEIRTRFLAYQIPLALGVTTSSITLMEQLTEKHSDNNINRYLPIQPDQLRRKNNQLRSQLVEIIAQDDLAWEALTDLRLRSVYLTLETVQGAMLHHGGRGYVKFSVAERKLREAYFLVNLTPTVKHLEAIKSRRKQAN